MPIRRGRFAPQNTFLETIAQKFDHGNSNFVLGSAQEKNNYPIVYCSDGFCELTGFSRSDLMRRSCACNFLYGLDSNREDIQSIETALRSQKELKKEILFYKKNGSPFHCLLDIVPIKNEKGNVVLFLVSHKDVTTRKLSNEVHGDEQASANGGTQQKLSRTKTRKFSRDVLLHLSRQYQQNNNTSKTTATRSFKRSRSFSFTSERLPQYKRESTKKSKFLFLHYSTEKGLWDWWILVLTFYIAIMVPYNVAFSRHGKARDLIIVDMVIELFFILDIVVHFRTTFVNHAGRIVYEQKAIAIHYLKGWFVLDFLAALPFEALYFINQSWASAAFDRKGSAFKEGFLVQLLKCGRLLRLFRVVRKLHRYTEYSTVLLTLLMLAFAMVAHWLACVWYVIGLEEVRDNSTVSWLYQFGEIIERPFVDFALDTGPDEGSAYVTALYFTLTSMTTVGFGNVSANTNAEKAFAVIVMLIGALMHAAIFGNVAAIIQKLYANRVRYHSRANEIKQFIRVHHIDGDLANRLEDYFHTTWSLSGGVDTREILSTFPNEIQSDVCMHLYKGFLELPLFNQAPRGLVRMLSLNVRPVYVGPGEYLLMQNDVINCIYYIASGSMEVLQGESVAAILGKGDLFGEDISRKGPIRKSNGDVRALTYCDIYFITRDLVQEVLHLYPDYAFKFSEKLELTYDLGASERDIWRRGGLDSISEDEEENDDDTSDSLETGSDVISTVRNRLDMKTSRATRTNNFTPNEPWRFYPRPKIRGFDFNEKEPLLSVPCEEVPSVSKINVLHPSNKQFSLSKESNVSNNEIDGADDAYLEWEPEPFILTQNDDAHKSSDEELNGIVVDSINTDNCNDNLEFREIENSSPRPTKSYKRAKDSFLKQLRSSAEDREHRNSIKTSNEYDDESDVEKGRADSFGLTEFVTPSQSPSLGMKRRSPNVSPAHSLNSNKSYRSRKSRSSLQRLEFPIAEGLQDNQIPYINECNQIPRQDSTRRNLSPSPAVDSPCFSIGRLFALTPPPIDDNDSPYGIHYASMPSSPARKKETGSSKSLRRNATADFISPASSCGGLSDDPRSTPNRRMRKMSTASAPPPSVFASLVAQASKSPYADFVPPTIVRESTITCNCDEEESCSICGDKESTQRPADDNMSSNESLDLVKTQKHKDSNTSVESNTTISDSEIAHKDFHLKKPKCSSQVSIKYLFGSFSSSCSAEQNALNVDDNQDFAEELSDRLLRRKRQLTRETAVYSSASQGDDDDSNRSTNSGKKTERDSNLYRMSWTSNSLDGLDKSTHSDDSEDAEDVRKVNVVKEDSVDDNIGAEIDFTTISEGNNSVRKRTVIENREIRNFPEPCLDERKRKEIDLPITSDDTSYPKQYQNENTQTDVDISAITEDAITTVTCLYKETEDDLGSSSKQPTASYIAHTETSPMPQQLQLETNDAKGPPLSHKNNRIPTFSCDRSTQSSLSSLSSQHMAALQYGTSLTDVSTNSTDNFINDIGGIGDTYHKQKPTTSGIHSTHSLNDLSNSGRAFAAAHILSYSEPQLQRPKTNAKHDDEGDIFNDDELEDIFKDVANAKQAMERLQMILSSPEPTLTSDLADTKETVQRLDQQVLTLNQDLASLRGDVKMVLELLKGLKNGQVGSNT